MNNKLPFNSIYRVIGSIFFISSIFYIGYIFLFCENKVIKLLSAIYISICVLLLILFLLFLRRKIISIYKIFDRYVDDIVSNKNDIEFRFERDDLVSKFQFKLKKLYEFMRDNNENVKQEKAEIQKLLSDISHQIKTPMANLKLYNSTLIERKLDEEGKKNFLYLMKGQLEKLDFLIQSLIKMSRLETGAIQINIKEKSVYETLASALGNIFIKAEEKNINIEVSCKSEIIASHDSKWTSEAIFNILDNAVKYSDYGGRIKIEVNELEIFVRIQICDEGRGINKENICRIFERFYREDEVSSIPGMGIGLYLAREIVSMEGGYIKVDSEKGKGSVFSIFLLK